MIIVSALLNANHMCAEGARAARSLGAQFVPSEPPSPSSPPGMNRLIVCATALTRLPVKSEGSNMCLWIMTCRLILLAFDSGGTLGTALINPALERGGVLLFGEHKRNLLQMIIISLNVF